MKKSNLIISAIAITLLGVVIVCLIAFKERPQWKAEKATLRNPAVVQKNIDTKIAFATSCSKVEELILESPLNIKGKVHVCDSNRFYPAPNGEVKIDTILENDGKKLTLRITPKPDGQVIYYDIQLLLPQAHTIRVHNVNLVLETKMRGMDISLKGESLCTIPRLTEPGTTIALTDLCALSYIPRYPDSVQIKASGNALVYTVEDIAKQMQQKGQLILTQNAIVRNN
jgi:hypothetical protein